MRAFSEHNPIAIFVHFMLVITIAMFIQNPIILLLALFGSILYYAVEKSLQGRLFSGYCFFY